MTARRFVDTNVLLYAISTAPEERAKAAISLEILEEPDLALSVQVLQEFYVQATRAGRKDALGHDQAVALVESWLRFAIQETTVGLMRAAMEAKVRYRLSFWDAAIIEAARMMGCRQVLSEDLSHGAEFGGIAVINPFRRSRRGP